MRDAAYYESLAEQAEDDAERLLAVGNDDAVRAKRLAERYRKMAETVRDHR